MTANDIHLLTGAYVLDSLDDADRAVFTRHLDECEGCAGEVAELRETVVRLADDSWAVPPPRLRQNVMDRIRATRQLPPVGLAPSASGRTEPAPPAKHAKPGWYKRAAYGLAAAILAVVAGGATYLVQEQRLQDIRAGQHEAAVRAAKIDAVLRAPDVAVKAGPVMGGGRVTVFTSPSQDAAVVFLSDATEPGPGSVYEFWMIENGTAKPATTLAAGAGDGTLYVEGLGRTETLGMTKEKAPGASTPTQPILAAVPLA